MRRGRARGTIPIVLLALGCGQSVRESERPWEPDPVDLGGETDVPGRRLRPLAWTASDEPTVRTALFHDSARNELCRFRLDQADTLRCFPVAVASDNVFGPLYADAGCREPVAVAGESIPISVGTTVEPAYVETVNETGCGGGTRLYELGEELVGMTLHSGPDCHGVIGIERAFRRGRRIPDSEFVRAREAHVIREMRLAARQITAEDGTARLQGFFDLDLDGACEPFELTSGERCVTTPVASQSIWPGELEMHGEECWDLVLDGDPCTPPRTGLVPRDDGIHAHEVVPASELGILSPAQDACLAVARANMDGPFWLFADEIPPEVFPELIRRDATGARLSLGGWAEPGSSLVLPFDENTHQIHDALLDWSCRLRIASDGVVRCLPGTVATTLFADPACSEPLWTIPEDFEVRYFRATRNDRVHVYEIGVRHSGEAYRDVSGGGTNCRVEGTWDGLYRAGPEIAPSEFVPFELTALGSRP